MSKFKIIPLYDYLRLIASLLVIYSHSFVLTGSTDRDWLERLTGKLDFAAVAVDFFFFLSGVLMFGALNRNSNIAHFILNRLARVFPGLFVCVVCGFFIGVFLTNLNLIDFLKNLNSWKYLVNIIFIFVPGMPGVFGDLPYSGVVNGSLWTLFYEMACYIFIALMTLLKIKFRLYVIIIMCGVFLYFGFNLLDNGPSLVGNFSRLGLFFCFGYLFSCGKTFENYIFFGCLTLFLVFYTLNFEKIIFVVNFLIIAFCSIIVKVANCIKNIPALKVDVSYGLYIYSFLIQQLLILACGIKKPENLFFLTIVFAVPVVFSSWFLIEKPGMFLIKNIKNRNLL